MADPNNPTIITATAFKPAGQWKYVYAVYEVRNQTPLTVAQIVPRLKGPGDLEFDADPNPYFETISDTAPNYVYRIHVRLRPRMAIAADPKGISPGLVGLEDFTFSIDLNVGSIYPPPSPVTEPVPVIEIDPCANITTP